MFDFASLPLTPDQARAARNYCGMTQAQAAAHSELPAYKIKRFELGNTVPDTEFLTSLRVFYEEQGYEFPDKEKPGAKAKATGNVFPEGVVHSEGDESISIGKPQKHLVQHIRIDPSLSDEEIGNIFDHIERNEEAVGDILCKKVDNGLFGGLAESSEALHGKTIRLLAENGSLLAKLLGRPIVTAPSQALATGGQAPKTHGELLAKLQADMHGAVSGDKEAVAKHKAQRVPQSLSNALFA